MAISKKTIIYPENTWPKQIGKRYYPTKKFLTYIDIIKDESAWVNGWIKPDRYLPFDLDLCLLKISGRELPGWWNGFHWKGLRLKSHHKVIAWKRTTFNHGIYDNSLQKNHSNYLGPSVYKKI